MINKKDIANKQDLEKLVRTFYEQVRKDDLLGSFFNNTIKGEDMWETHYNLLVSFWELNLLGISGFNGNPALAHQGVDRNFKNSITTDHFERWVSIWTLTIHELFEGEIAELAIQKANNMAKGMYKKVLDKRPGGFILPGGASGITFS